MQLRLNLQWKVLLLVAGTITIILLVSTYLHGLITKSLSEEYRYNNAIRQVVTVAKRTQTYNYLASPSDLLQEIQFLVNSRPDFNEFGEMERPLPDVTTFEIERDGLRQWVITAAITQSEGRGYVSALVQKTSRTDFISRLQFQHNMVLGGASVLSIALLYFLFVIFFRRPAQDIATAMAQVPTRALFALAAVRREDELGTIAACLY